MSSVVPASVRPSLFTLAEILKFFRAQRKTVLTLAGYSGAGYEKPDRLRKRVVRLLKGHDPARTLINIGTTADGIGRAYAWAKKRGFVTTGIVSSAALDCGAELSPWCDHPFFVADETWGGFIDGKLSPTSEAMVQVSDLMIAYGGGDIARDELTEMRRRGKTCVFHPDDMNHAKAAAKAQAKGLPAPSSESLQGSAHSAFAPKPPSLP